MLKRSLLVLVVALLVGCSLPTPPTETPTPSPAPTEATPASPAALTLERSGDGFRLTGSDQVALPRWAPSGRKAVTATPTAAYLLDLDGVKVTPLAGWLPRGDWFFWTEHSLAWFDQGRFSVRDLNTGIDTLLADFGGPVDHLIRPGDAALVAVRLADPDTPSYLSRPYGEVLLARTGEVTTLLKEGHLAGRLAAGSTLVREGRAEGPLHLIGPDGESKLLTDQVARSPQVAPTGDRILWFTGPGQQVDTLWVWNGTGGPHRIPLGRVTDPYALFSPTGREIALSYVDEAGKGRLNVLNGTAMDLLYTHDLHIPIWLWNNGEPIFTLPSPEKTGAEPGFLRAVKGEAVPVPGSFSSQVTLEEGPRFFLHWPEAGIRRELLGTDRWYSVPKGKPTDPYVMTHTGKGYQLIKLGPPER